MVVSLSLCCIALSTLLALWFLKIYVTHDKSRPKQQLPPGPWTLPIIGSAHHLISDVRHQKITELCRRHGPVMLLWLGEVPAVVVSTAEVTAMVMKTKDPLFADRTTCATIEIFGGGGKGIAFAPYGDRWRQMRKMCIVELLSAKQVKRMEGIRAEEVRNLVQYITATVTAATSTGATINIRAKVATLSSDVVSRAVFGGKFTRQKEYLHELAQGLVMLAGSWLVDMFPSSWLVRTLTNGERYTKRSYGRIQRIIMDIMEDRKVENASGDRACSSTDDEDLLDVLRRLQADDTLEFPITAEIIGVVLIDIFNAAAESTGSVLEWAMSELITHPQAMSKAQLEVRQILGEEKTVITNGDLAELHYMRRVIKEVLRLHPPLPLVPRKCRDDCTIMGYHVPKGTNVFVNIFAVSRDPNYWANPEEFKPERFKENNMDYKGTLPNFTPFGAGRRQCPGIQFSLSLLEVTLANLLYHFDWMLPNGSTIASFDMSEKFTCTLSKKYGLQLRAVPHTCFKATPQK